MNETEAPDKVAPRRQSMAFPQTLLWIGAALAMMIPWPMLAAIFCSKWIDRADEAVLFLGGATGLLIFPVTILVNLSNEVFTVAIIIVWLAAWLGPPLFLMRRGPTQKSVLLVLLLQSLFSLVQAALGALILLGKGV